MDTEVIIVNLAYATYAVTAFCRQMRTLRIVMLTSSLLFAPFGLAVEIHSVAAWNLGLALLTAHSLLRPAGAWSRPWNTTTTSTAVTSLRSHT